MSRTELTENEVVAMRPALYALQGEQRAIAVVALHELTANEIAALRFKDFDFEAGIINIEGELPAGEHIWEGLHAFDAALARMGIDGAFVPAVAEARARRQ